MSTMSLQPLPQDTLLRSSEMTLTKLHILPEVGRDVMHSLGELGVMDFIDMNEETTSFKREFTSEIARWDNVERQLRFFQSQIHQAGLPMASVYDFEDEAQTPSSAAMDEFVDRCNQLESSISGWIDTEIRFRFRQKELLERLSVLREAGGFFDRARRNQDDIRPPSRDSDDAPLLQDVEQNYTGGAATSQQTFTDPGIRFVSGVIARERLPTLERVLWRTLRGNLYLNQSEIATPIFDPDSQELVSKNVFVVFAHGSQTVSKIRKIALALGASLYVVDEEDQDRSSQQVEVELNLAETKTALRTTRQTLNAELRHIGKTLAAWMVPVKKEKAVYENLNKLSFDSGTGAPKILVATAWCPSSSVGHIRTTLDILNNRLGVSAPSVLERISTESVPPTYIKTNKFTHAFQTIIDAYGTAKFGEINPCLPTLVTFPFLFAVMFGDLGHALILTMIAGTMIYFEKPMSRSKLDELLSMAFSGRYIMLMMGIFSLYTGLIYSDMFSKVIPMFPSMWKWPSDFRTGETVIASRVSGYTYPFGLDWSWHETENDLLFSNSYKMKMSILLGWAHMTFSLCLSYLNSRHLKSPIDLWGNFVPGMIFFQSIFGYLAFSIVYKWSVDWYGLGREPPSLLNMLINMFLHPTTIETPLYSGQAFVQQVLLVLALLCVPVLLFLKPFYLRREHLSHQGYGQLHQDDSHSTDLDDVDGHEPSSPNEETDLDLSDATAVPSDGHDEFDFVDAMVHQVIHTIEFCLNCVSHTASYLRLWALSLAHQQLSIVLWNMTLGIAFSKTGIVGTIASVCLFTLWFTLTVSVLCAMEGTSAMLHSLRLHWVEAMSKHFIGEGVPFQPFSFAAMLEEDPID